MSSHMLSGSWLASSSLSLLERGAYASAYAASQALELLVLAATECSTVQCQLLLYVLPHAVRQLTGLIYTVAAGACSVCLSLL